MTAFLIRKARYIKQSNDTSICLCVINSKYKHFSEWTQKANVQQLNERLE
jgi:hypothetical protein